MTGLLALVGGVGAFAQSIRFAPEEAYSPWPPFDVDKAVCRPALDVDGKARRTGTAFVLEADVSKPKLFLIMAQHLFGMAGPTEIPWREMPHRARSASCRTLDSQSTWEAGEAFAVPGAHAMGPLSTLKDIAILPIRPENNNVGPSAYNSLRLGTEPPRPGETVWLVAQVTDPHRANQHLFAAQVIPTSGFLAYVYKDRALDLSNTSGAPVVNTHGGVIGVNVAVAHQNGETIGLADDLATIQAALRSAGGL